MGIVRAFRRAVGDFFYDLKSALGFVPIPKLQGRGWEDGCFNTQADLEKAREDMRRNPLPAGLLI